MKHHATPKFWAAYDALPNPVRGIADKNFSLLKIDPDHPSLRFKRVGRFWSVRVGLGYRSLALREGDDLIWFWIGTHAEYDRLVGR